MLPNEKYGMLTVLELDHISVHPINQRKAEHYKCKCDCGNECVKPRRVLSLPSATRNCGCKPPKLRKQPEELALNNYIRILKKSALVRGIPFKLNREQVHALIHSPCQYCGDVNSLTQIYPHPFYEFRYTGIDRVDSSRGYTTDNVVPCCWKCNRMKESFSANDFVAHAQKVAFYKTSL